MTNKTNQINENGREETPQAVSTAEKYAACGNERCSYNKTGRKIVSRNGQTPNYCGNCGYRAIPYLDEEVRKTEQDGIMKILRDRAVNEDVRLKLLEKLDDSYLVEIVSDEEVRGCIGEKALTMIKSQELLYRGIIEHRKLDYTGAGGTYYTWGYKEAVPRLSLDNLNKLREELARRNKDKPYEKRDSLEDFVRNVIQERKQNIAKQLAGETADSSGVKKTETAERKGILARIFGGRK